MLKPRPFTAKPSSKAIVSETASKARPLTSKQAVLPTYESI
jgi:hypothetical protein